MMLRLRKLQLRVRSILRRHTLDTELKQELEFHIAEQKAEYLSRGMSEVEAGLAARRSFGSAPSFAEQCRDERRTRWLDDLARDTRFAIRTLLSSPALTVAAVATLALGVGANLAFFSTAYTILFRALPYPEPGRLVEMEVGIGGVGPTTALRERAATTDYAGYFPNVESNVQLRGEAVRLQAAAVTWNLARVLAVQPASGRWFEPREERAGQHRVAVVSDRMWRERLGADPRAVGRSILVNEEPYEIVGVMPARFAFPSPATELWLPVRLDPANRSYMWGNLNLWPIGRLRDGASLSSAQAELLPAIDRIRPMFPWRMPDEWGRSSRLVLHSHALVKHAQPKLIALAAASLLLLVIACGNVANLLMARWVRREREFTVREALGAGRGRLLRQFVTENLVLATMGSAAGAAAAAALLKVLPWLLEEIPRTEELSIDARAAIAAAVIMLMTFAVLSIAPMLRSKILRGQPASSSRNTSSRGSARMSLALAGLQLALATALLIGAGLMGRTLARLASLDSGVHAAGVITASISAGPSRCAAVERCWAFLQDLNGALAGVDGVRSVSWSNGTPLIKKFLRCRLISRIIRKRLVLLPSFCGT